MMIERTRKRQIAKAKQIDSGYKRIEIMVDQKLKEAGVE